MIIILTYHSISEKKYKYSVTPDMFRWQIATLKRKFEIISLQKLEELMNSKFESSRNYAVITFDDGIEDNYQNAFPILKELNVPATIFITTNLMDKEITNNSGFTFHFLNWDQISEMRASGMIDFAAHTHTHPKLVNMTGENIEKEFSESRKVFVQMFGAPARYFAYPKGISDPVSRDAVAKEYKLAFGANGIIERFDKLDKLFLPRVIVYKNISKIKFLILLEPFMWMLRKYYKNL